MTDEIATLIANHKVLINLGAGGVGKTSCSIGLAIYAAQLGKRVGLLSIDPAKRLAGALGIELGAELRRIDLGDEISGEVYAAMLDQKVVFDMMVKKHGSSQEQYEKIVSNILYKTISENFAGAVEYMALAKLHNMLSENKYDLIVLDTPPHIHALDFLTKPNILHNFKEHKVLPWLIKPFHLASKFKFEKFFSVTERLMGGIARITGLQTLKVVAEFLVLLQTVIENFENIGDQLGTIFRKDSTAFCLITTANQTTLKITTKMIEKLHEMGFSLDMLVLNRSLEAFFSEPLQFESPDLKLPLEHLRSRYQYENTFLSTIQSCYKRINENAPRMISIQDLDYGLHSKESMLQFAKLFAK